MKNAIHYVVLDVHKETIAVALCDSERVLAAEASVLCTILLCGLKMRNTLLRNAFHRRVYLVVVLYMLQKLSMEVAAIRYKVPFITFLATDLVGLAGISSMIAALFLPSIWWLPIYLFGVSGLTVIYGKSVAWLGMTCYSVACGAVVLAWSAAASDQQAQQTVQYADVMEFVPCS